MSPQPTPFEIEQAAFKLRHRLAQQLSNAGYLRSPAWRAAVESVPRHEFLGEFFAASDPDQMPTVYRPVSPKQVGVARWLELVYTDETWVTQLDGRLMPRDVPADGFAENRVPTSSSSLPSLVVDMWERLDVADGDRVLEIGTGTGYSIALGCHRLGESQVTSIELDPDVAARARAGLNRAGYRPALVIGDGAAGVADAATADPFDRVIATCSWRSVPPAWIAQTRPGGTILVTLSGWLDATGLAKLTVTGPGSAEGAFVDPHVSFMPARAQERGFLMLPDISETPISERPAVIGPDVFDGPDSAARRVVQLAAPNAQYLPSVQLGDGTVDGGPMLVESDDSSAAFNRTSDGGWIVRQGGRRPLWDEVEPAVIGWRDAGEPPITEFRITVTPERQTVAFAPGHALDLPSYL